MTSLSTLLTTGYCQPIKVGEIVKLYRDLISSSVPTHGKIQYLSSDTYSLTNYSRAIDCDNLESIATFKVYSLKGKEEDLCDEGGQGVDSVRCISGIHGVSELASDTSLNGRYLARLKSLPSREGSAKRQLLEIWDRYKLLKSLDTSDLNVHGPINTDAHFGRLVWSPFGEQDKLLYVCQPKRSKSMSFFRDSPSDKSDTNRGEEFLKRDNWGERLIDIEHTIIAVLDVASDCCITTTEVEGYSLGTPQWLDNGTKVVSVAYKENPRFPGILHSNNRVSKIMIHDWKSGELIMKLESDTECFHTLRANNAGNKFLYCKNDAYGTSSHTVKLRIYDMVARRVTGLADELFIEKLPNSCFTSDDKHVLFVKADHLNHHMCLINLETLKISKINFPTTGLSVLDFRYDIILASGSEPNATPVPFVAKLCLSCLDNFVSWNPIEESRHFDELDYETFKIATPDDESSFLSAILVKPSAKALRRNLKIGGTNLPTVVRVHGGPASAYHVCYSPDIVLYAKLGLQTLLINYRGSTGVSEKYTESLHGLVGKQDVEDCLHVLRHVVKEKLIDPNRLVILGGSHGGFLACHLSCQEEFKFTSAIMFNPVVDLSSMIDASCQADYIFTVNLKRKNYHTSWLGPSSQERMRLFECSPIFKSSIANVPTLVFLGSQDKVVPMSQGERWVSALKARGVETLCKVYADGHSVSRPEHLADSVITSLIWILNHLPKC